jgi:hypothetical protein
MLLVIAVAVGLWRNQVVWYSAFPWTTAKLHFSVEYVLILVSFTGIGSGSPWRAPGFIL